MNASVLQQETGKRRAFQGPAESSRLAQATTDTLERNVDVADLIIFSASSYNSLKQGLKTSKRVSTQLCSGLQLGKENCQTQNRIGLKETLKWNVKRAMLKPTALRPSIFWSDKTNQILLSFVEVLLVKSRTFIGPLVSTSSSGYFREYV